MKKLIKIITGGIERWRDVFAGIDAVVDAAFLVCRTSAEGPVVRHFFLIIPQFRVNPVRVRFYRTNIFYQLSGLIQNFLVIFLEN